MYYSSHFLCLASALQTVTAFPGVVNELSKRQNLPTGQSGSVLSKNEPNTGIIPTAIFNAEEQYVNVAPGSAHEFVAPGSGDLRGECPGLNAAANHGFLPHNGIANTEQTIEGLGAAYGMGADLAGFLAVVAIVLDGDPIAGTWSIGGPYASASGGLLGQPLGILNAHDKYEGDASISRFDAYLNNGNPGDMDINKYSMLYDMTNNFTLDVMRQHNAAVQKMSVSTNPYYFSAPFAGLVTPAAHEFVPNLMSNHSAEHPEGYLNRDMLNTFFSVTGSQGDLTWTPGHEQIPQNWYRRPSSDPYCLECNLADTAITLLAYPNAVVIGGNTGTPNSFVGIDPADLTGGTYSSSNLAEGNNLACFMFQFLLAATPDFLKGGVAPAAAQTLMEKTLTPLISSYGCPQLAKYNTEPLEQFPGYNYKQPLQS